MTQPQTESLTPYAPLPVRARGTLEIFDTAFKLFRRYAGVLLAWSALSGIINLIPVVGSLGYIFTMPLLYGAVACVVAGAVRGQKVGFKQVWGFTKPRYGALLGILILALILMSVVMFALMFVGLLLVVVFAGVASYFGTFATVVAWIVGTIGGLIGSSFLLALVMGWFNLAPVIACLEDANRGSNALTRAWVLLKGSWRKACAVATILALAGTSALFIVFGFVMFFFYGGWDKFIGANNADSFLSGLAVSGFSTLFFMAWTPLQAVVGAVFYLDLRTRKEALDLEWTNYAAKPETLPLEVQPAPQPQFTPAPSVPAPSLPASGPPIYTPPSSLQTPPVNGAGLPQSQTPSFGAPPVQATPPVQPVSQQDDAGASVPVTHDSFAAFAAHVEAAPQNVAPVPAPALEVVPVPVEAQNGGVTVEVQSVPVVPVEVAPALQNPASLPAEVAVPVENLAPTFGAAPGVSPAPVIVEPPVAIEPQSAPPVPVAPAPPVPVAPAPPVPVAPAPPVPVAPAPPVPSETSSFAPPPRFRRAASEDDDYPSSFGGGAR